MSVPKSKRKASPFEVFHHLYTVRREITDLALRNFGYSEEAAKKRLEKLFGERSFEELNEDEQKRYLGIEKRNEAFFTWFIEDERKCIISYVREIVKEVFCANSIYPTILDELYERRLCQDRAIGLCITLMQELQYTLETLPVDVNKHLRFADMLQHEISLIKGWRKSDNKFSKVLNNGAPSERSTTTTSPMSTPMATSTTTTLTTTTTSGPPSIP